MIVAGFGYRTGAVAASFHAALALAQRDHPAVTALAAPGDKIAPLAALAEMLGLSLIGIGPAELLGVATHTQSRASLAARGTGSVAEAAALAAAGTGARLIAHRHISPDRMVTCAIAEGLEP